MSLERALTLWGQQDTEVSVFMPITLNVVETSLAKLVDRSSGHGVIIDQAELVVVAARPRAKAVGGYTVLAASRQEGLDVAVRTILYNDEDATGKARTEAAALGLSTNRLHPVTPYIRFESDLNHLDVAQRRFGTVVVPYALDHRDRGKVPSLVPIQSIAGNEELSNQVVYDTLLALKVLEQA